MTTTVGALAFVPPPSRPPKTGQSPAIAVGTYPNGTPISLTRVIGRRFTLVGKKASGADNAAAIYIGSATKKVVLLDVGDAGSINLISPDDSFVNLADYLMSGTDGDGCSWLLVD